MGAPQAVDDSGRAQASCAAHARTRYARAACGVLHSSATTGSPRVVVRGPGDALFLPEVLVGATNAFESHRSMNTFSSTKTELETTPPLDRDCLDKRH